MSDGINVLRDGALVAMAGGAVGGIGILIQRSVKTARNQMKIMQSLCVIVKEMSGDLQFQYAMTRTMLRSHETTLEAIVGNVNGNVGDMLIEIKAQTTALDQKLNAKIADCSGIEVDVA